MAHRKSNPMPARARKHSEKEALMKFRYAVALLSLALSSAAFAADPALKQLDFFKGTWQCKGTQTFTGPTIHYTATVTGTWVLDGQWLDIHVTQNKTKENPQPFNGRAYMGYDTGTKKYMVGWVDNTGGYETAAFSGWQGNKLVWEGPAHMGAMVANSRDTFVKDGTNKLTHTVDMEEKGKWSEMMKETCTK